MPVPGHARARDAHPPSAPSRIPAHSGASRGLVPAQRPGRQCTAQTGACISPRARQPLLSGTGRPERTPARVPALARSIDAALHCTRARPTAVAQRARGMARRARTRGWGSAGFITPYPARGRYVFRVWHSLA
ncbi:hypothetical protein HYPSUDRAFT_205139 [Hypholoma sublateritium FD-334 SS-4]|uniref:Uncharacterized protein n=1 Tax=Hypholoma sublateritium (strain FD-334 SS-4) TaxID=945553 RepID=A0A0D2NPT9_HYPSF|nr:hypothetical protein HYPSUDRAFT_205139 [Hypholoma sublateritium FD-334 SS-4]